MIVSCAVYMANGDEVGQSIGRSVALFPTLFGGSYGTAVALRVIGDVLPLQDYADSPADGDF